MARKSSPSAAPRAGSGASRAAAGLGVGHVAQQLVAQGRVAAQLAQELGVDRPMSDGHDLGAAHRVLASLAELSLVALGAAVAIGAGVAAGAAAGPHPRISAPPRRPGGPRRTCRR